MTKTKRILELLVVLLIAHFISGLLTISFLNASQVAYNIPEERITLIFWGDLFLIRVLFSLLSSFVAGCFIGLFQEKRLLPAILFSIPIILFWGIILVAYYSGDMYEQYGFFSRYNFIPLILILLTFPTTLIATLYIRIDHDESSIFELFKTKEFYHFLWIIPTLFIQIVSLCSFFFLIISQIQDENNTYGISVIEMLIHDLNGTIKYYVVLTCLIIIFSLILASGYHLFHLIFRNEYMRFKFKWVQVFLIVIFLNFLYYYIIGIHLI
jgi:hypothetical protein